MTATELEHREYRGTRVTVAALVITVLLVCTVVESCTDPQHPAPAAVQLPIQNTGQLLPLPNNREY